MSKRPRQNTTRGTRRGATKLRGCADPTELSAPAPGQSGHTSCHSACVACREKAHGGLGLQFRSESDGTLVAQFFCDPVNCSYPENVHGGHLALLLDAAMGHCLFEHGIIAVTGRLNIGYGEPVRVGQPAQVRVAIHDHQEELYRVQGEIVQAGRVCVRAEGKFTIRQ